MTGLLTRYEDDASSPSVGSAVRDVWMRAVLPAVALFAAVVAIGWLVVGPLAGSARENGVNAAIQQCRTPTWDAVTRVWSILGNTEVVIGACVLVVALVWWRTRQWWYAVLPAIAISLQASVFVAASTIVDRSRPDAAQLDPAPPTSGFPSGHVGAATALCVTVAMMAHRIAMPWVRRLVVLVCVVVPVLVAYARLYRGMHYPSDVLVGAANGIWCALLAWLYLRRVRPGDQPDGPGRPDAGVPGPGERVDRVGSETERDDDQEHNAPQP